MNVKQEDFDRVLSELLDEQPASHLLTVPGIYEVVSEHFNNDVLRRIKEEQEDD